MATINFEEIDNITQNAYGNEKFYRARIADGWLVGTQNYSGGTAQSLTFVPDPKHEWK